MIYLTHFVNELKFREAMHLCFSHMKDNPFFERMKADIKETLFTLFFHKLFPMLSGFVNHVTEPLTVNDYPQMLNDNQWVFAKHHYYKLTVKQQYEGNEYDGEIVCGIFKTTLGHTFVIINQMGDYNVSVEYFHFDEEWLLRKYHTNTFKVFTGEELFPKEGKNYMSSLGEPSWCHKANLRKIIPAYTVVETNPIFTEILTKVENHDSNSP